MTDEFDGKSFDLEKDETKDKDGNESEDDKNDDDLDKEMGELGPDAESLDPSVSILLRVSYVIYILLMVSFRIINLWNIQLLHLQFSIGIVPVFRTTKVFLRGDVNFFSESQ